MSFVMMNDELNTAELPHRYNHRPAHVRFMAISAPVEAMLLTICAETKVGFDDQLLACYFLKCS